MLHITWDKPGVDGKQAVRVSWESSPTPPWLRYVWIAVAVLAIVNLYGTLFVWGW